MTGDAEAVFVDTSILVYATVVSAPCIDLDKNSG